METEKVPLSEDLKHCASLKRRLAVRFLKDDEFIERHASGTLRKNRRLGMAWRKQYLQERVAYEFGFGFECLPRSYVTYGDANTEGDSKAVTEAGWHMERYLELSIFPEDRYEAKYIMVDHDNEHREGIGIIVRATSAPFIPDGHIIFAIVAEYDLIKRDFRRARNPA